MTIDWKKPQVIKKTSNIYHFSKNPLFRRKEFIHIYLPILTPGLIVGATFAFAVSMGEFGASLLLVRPEFTTMPVAIFRLLGQPGSSNFGQALAMSSLLMMIVAAGFIAIERLRYRNSGGF